MHSNILALASHPACSWSCQYKKGWGTVPNSTGSVVPNHNGDIMLVAIVIVVALLIWGLGKMRRIVA